MNRSSLLRFLGLAPLAALATKLTPSEPALIQGEVAYVPAAELGYGPLNVWGTPLLEEPEYELIVGGLNNGTYTTITGLGTDTLPESASETMEFCQTALSRYQGYLGMDRFEIWRKGIGVIFQGRLSPGIVPAGWQEDFFGGPLPGRNYWPLP